MLYQASKPFARGRDDDELDSMLKERTRFGDPMAHLVKKPKKNPELWMPPVIDDSNREMFAKSGLIMLQFCETIIVPWEKSSPSHIFCA